MSKSRFPHVVIRASAGTGKTYQLAVRFIGLLAAGVRPEEILATTFTRKAAGEILDRVLAWLAAAAGDDAERAHLAAAIGDKSLSRERCRELLVETIHSLHRLRIGTLDSHFIQMATSFGQELGLPPGWSICDELVDAALRDEAIELVLAHGKLSDLLTLVHSLTKGATQRSVGRLMHGTISGLFELYRETAPEAWDRLPVPKGLSDDELPRAINALAACGVAEKQQAKAKDGDVERARLADWDGFIAKGCASKVLSGDCTFYKKPIPADLAALYQPLLRHAAAILVGRVARQTQATHELLTRFAEHYHALQHDERVLRFGDVTYRLAAGTALAPERLAFRLDGPIRHVLLDEFQDTAPSQWNVIRSLAQSVTSKNGGSFFCVGDAKQAIYGWRGGVAEIFDALDGELGSLSHHTLAESYRSSQPVIDAVNQVFQNLTDHPNLGNLAEAVAAWQAAFPPHTTAKKELAGYVRLEVAPAPADDEDADDAMYRYAAQQVVAAIEQAPAASVGVLVRTNDAVARLIYQLRDLGVPASEEGGNPLIDSPAVELLLSLLRLADHPGDRVARFHLAHSPLAGPLELADHRDDAAAARIARRLRRQLLEEGYGQTVYAWAKRLAASCDARDQSRLQQLVELAYDYAAASTLRTDDFRRLVESKRIADPTSSDVRVMTIHQAKGLEFDIVVLPELDEGLVGQRDTFVIGRPGPTQPIEVVCRYANEDERRFFPLALQKLFDDNRNSEVTESLCVLYVAMTRAIHELHMVLPPPKANEKSLPKKYSGLLRATLSAGQQATPGKLLYEHGNPRWEQSLPPEKRGHAAAIAARVDAAPPAIRLAPAPKQRDRNLERTSPSALEGGTRLAASSVLSSRSDAALGLGTLVHAWIEQVAWLDEGLPSDETLRAVAVQLRSEIGDVATGLDGFIAAFRKQLAAPAVAAVLQRSFYDSPAQLGLSALAAGEWQRGDVELTVSRERPFAIRDGEQLLSGSIDRLITIRRGGRPIAADVVDFKTDQLAPGDAAALAKKVEFYRPQLEGYRTAVARLLALGRDRIAARLVFLSSGAVVDVSSAPVAPKPSGKRQRGLF